MSNAGTNSNANQGPSTKMVQPKTKAGKRALEKKAPKLVEEPRKALILAGHKTSKTVKELLVDVQKMKATESIKMTSRKHDILPFETGGEVEIEGYSSKSDASLFILGNHTKKRPDNIVMGRMYDYKLYDMMEFGVEDFKSLNSFKASTIPQLGNKPAFVFAGQEFTTSKALIQAKSLLLDFFRGRQVDNINLKGLDRVIYVSYAEDERVAATRSLDDDVAPKIVFRQFAVRYKKSGTDVPRTVLEEMGPHFDLRVRRRREAGVDMEREAMKQAKLTPKKQKNVKADVLDGKVGKVYVQRQDVSKIAMGKMKGAKRERREAAAQRKTKNKLQ